MCQMTFDWNIVEMFLEQGKKVRHESWEKGKFITVFNREIVDENGKPLSKQDLKYYKHRKPFWTQYMFD